MSVVRSAYFAFAQTTGPSSTTGSATPIVGDAIFGITAVWNQGSTSTAPTITGTGTYSVLPSVPYWQDGAQGDNLLAVNSSATAGSQTVTGIGHSPSVGNVNTWAVSYSGANVATSSGSQIQRTGGGAVLGTAVSVPVGAVLFCWCFDSGNGTGTITAGAGSTQIANDPTTGWCLSEYAGAGASITPSFTTTIFSGFVNVLQVLILPSASNSAPVYWFS